MQQVSWHRMGGTRKSLHAIKVNWMVDTIGGSNKNTIITILRSYNTHWSPRTKSWYSFVFVDTITVKNTIPPVLDFWVFFTIFLSLTRKNNAWVLFCSCNTLIGCPYFYASKVIVCQNDSWIQVKSTKGICVSKTLDWQSDIHSLDKQY